MFNVHCTKKCFTFGINCGIKLFGDWSTTQCSRLRGNSVTISVIMFGAAAFGSSPSGREVTQFKASSTRLGVSSVQGLDLHSIYPRAALLYISSTWFSHSKSPGSLRGNNDFALIYALCPIDAIFRFSGMQLFTSATWRLYCSCMIDDLPITSF